MAIPPPAIHVQNTEVEITSGSSMSLASTVASNFQTDDPLEPTPVVSGGSFETSYTFTLTWTPTTPGTENSVFSGSASSAQIEQLVTDLQPTKPSPSGPVSFDLTDSNPNPPATGPGQWTVQIDCTVAVRTGKSPNYTYAPATSNHTMWVYTCPDTLQSVLDAGKTANGESA